MSGRQVPTYGNKKNKTWKRKFRLNTTLVTRVFADDIKYTVI